MPGSIGEQVSFHLSDNEAKIFWAEVERRGYPKDKDGAVDMIFDLIEGGERIEGQGLGGLIRKHIEENPAQVQALLKVGGNLMQDILKKVRGA